MPGLVPGIHVFGWFRQKGVDGRDEPGHDEGKAVRLTRVSIAAPHNARNMKRAAPP
jgi:hypothetical protein